MKRLIAILLSLSMLFAFTSCADKNENADLDESTSDNTSNVADDLPADAENQTEVVTEIVTNEEGETEIVTEIVTKKKDKKEDASSSKDGTTKKDEKTTSKKESTTSSDPSKWSKKEVVAFYKKACLKSSKAVSTQTMVMRKDSLHVDGVADGILSFAEFIIRNVMKLQETETEGITGGHTQLTADDCKSAKAYKSGNYTIVEMTMVNQTDGIYGDTYSGTVGHAISVVGGVAMVAEKFSDWDVNYKEADIKIHYTDAKLKVKINSKGVIEKGTWSYVVTPKVNGLVVEGINVNNAGAVVDYKVVVGGGF